MGRDGVLPGGFFGHLDPIRHTPTYNALLTGAIALTVALFVSYQAGAELLNFGAFIAFMSVNLAALFRYYVREGPRNGKSILLNLAPPLAGFTICLYIWWSLRTPAKIAGGCWLLLGVGYCAWKTGFFKRRLMLPDAGLENQ
jgi:amino acid transporter